MTSQSCYCNNKGKITNWLTTEIIYFKTNRINLQMVYYDQIVLSGS